MLEKILANGKIKIHYKVKKGKESPIIFLHGEGSSMSAWEVMMPYMQGRTNTLILVDFRGHGLSDRPNSKKDYTLEKHAEDIDKIIEKEKLAKVILVGYCLGSMVAATFVCIHPEKVEKLVLINTGFELPWFMKKIFILPIIHFLALFKAKRIKAKCVARVDYSKYLNSADIHIGRLLADLKATGIASSLLQFLAWFEWDGRKYFSGLTVPTLVIAGKKDSFFPPAQTEKVVKLIKQAKVNYIDSNHISIVNKPEEVYRNMAKFL